jgi:hypothetical protein
MNGVDDGAVTAAGAGAEVVGASVDSLALGLLGRGYWGVIDPM